MIACNFPSKGGIDWILLLMIRQEKYLLKAERQGKGRKQNANNVFLLFLLRKQINSISMVKQPGMKIRTTSKHHKRFYETDDAWIFVPHLWKRSASHILRPHKGFSRTRLKNMQNDFWCQRHIMQSLRTSFAFFWDFATSTVGGEAAKAETLP